MSSIIAVENLSKKYIIGHQKKERYTALRDIMANGAKRFAHKLTHPFAAKENDPTHEEFWALKDVSFDIQQGDRVGIIGRNGAGKSTLLKILSRITEPTSGRISIKGRVASLLEVGTGFHPELTGRENIFLNGAILGMSKVEIKRKFDEIVAFSEVEKFLDTPVKRYSSGMYVRLAFAVAAHLEPEILIVDEVLAVGDAAFQKKCLGRMEEVGKEGRTVLFVSHNFAAISTLCNKGILITAGEAGQVEDIEKTLLSYNQLALRNSSLSLTSNCKRFKVKPPYFENDNHMIIDAFSFGDNVTIVLEADFLDKFININPGFALLNNRDERLATFHYKDSKNYSTEGPFDKSVKYKCKFSLYDLAPGHYKVIFGVRNENEDNAVYDPNLVVGFEVTSNKAHFIASYSGMLWRNSEWEIRGL
jgi:lipopolysaccharide transport system ATP-binding protein